MDGVAILVPVLNRPGNVAPLLESIRANTPEPYVVVFLADPGDRAEQDAIAARAGPDVRVLSPGGTYAKKINHGVRQTDALYVMLGADDVRFHPGWLEAAKAAMTDGVQVVGLRDLIDRPTRPEHATHFLLTREAALMPCIDGSQGCLHEGYRHWRTDDELIATATKRGMYVYAPGAVVEHRHPMTGAVPDDATYRKGRATARRDGKLFHRRERLWAR